MQGGDGFVVLADPLNPRIVYSESQDGNIQRKNAETGESRSIRPDVHEHQSARRPKARCRSGSTGTRRSCPLAARDRRAARGREQGVQVDRSRRLVDGDQPGPDDERRPQRDRDDGRSGQRDPHRRATTASPAGRRSCRSPNRRSRPASTSPARMTASCSMSKDAGKTWTNVTNKLPGFPAGRVDVRSRAVAVRRRHGLRHGRCPPAERLQDLHLGEHRLRRDVPVAQRAT